MPRGNFAQLLAERGTALAQVRTRDCSAGRAVSDASVIFGHWLPLVARDHWLGRMTRDDALLMLVRLCPVYRERHAPGALDHLLGQRLERLTEQFRALEIDLTRPVDAMIDAGRKGPEIRVYAEAVAAEAGFPDVSLDSFFAERVQAWKWRRRHRRAA